MRLCVRAVSLSAMKPKETRTPPQVSNSAHDTALSHASLEDILASQRRLVLAIVGGRQRGFTDPEDGHVWSQTVEALLRRTRQALAIQVADEGRAMSWLQEPSWHQQSVLADKLGLPATPRAAAVLAVLRSPWPPTLQTVGFAAAAVGMAALATGALYRDERTVLDRLDGSVGVKFKAQMAGLGLLMSGAVLVCLHHL